MHVGRRAAGVAATIAGAALLAWQIRSVGLDGISDGLSRVGWGFLLILGLTLMRYALRSAAWITVVGGTLPFGRTLAATIAGDALGNVTPLSLAVSEPAKSMYMRTHLPVAQSLAALAAENFFYSLSVALYIVAGTCALLQTFDMPPNVRLAAWIALILMAAVLAAALWIVWRRPAVASRPLSWLPFKLDTLLERVRTFEARTYDFVRQTRGRLAVVAACEAAFHVLSFAESYTVLWLLTGQSRPLAALILDTFNRIVNIVFKWVPLGRPGIDEGVSQLVAPTVGLLTTTGFLVALVRKIRVFAWMAIGLALAGLALRNQSPKRSV